MRRALPLVCLVLCSCIVSGPDRAPSYDAARCQAITQEVFALGQQSGSCGSSCATLGGPLETYPTSNCVQTVFLCDGVTIARDTPQYTRALRLLDEYLERGCAAENYQCHCWGDPYDIDAGIEDATIPDAYVPDAYVPPDAFVP